MKNPTPPGATHATYLGSIRQRKPLRGRRGGDQRSPEEAEKMKKDPNGAKVSQRKSLRGQRGGDQRGLEGAEIRKRAQTAQRHVRKSWRSKIPRSDTNERGDYEVTTKSHSVSHLIKESYRVIHALPR